MAPYNLRAQPAALYKQGAPKAVLLECKAQTAGLPSRETQLTASLSQPQNTGRKPGLPTNAANLTHPLPRADLMGKGILLPKQLCLDKHAGTNGRIQGL